MEKEIKDVESLNDFKKLFEDYEKLKDSYATLEKEHRVLLKENLELFKNSKNSRGQDSYEDESTLKEFVRYFER